jgi:hyaluronoglucosaminidase
MGSFSNSGGMTASLMFDGDSTTYYTSGVSQKDGSWVGVDLRTVRDIRGVSILQGRNSTDDVDYFDHAVVEYSVDGKDWKPLTGELEGQYVINWSGEGVEARYVRLKRLASDRKNYIAIRSFDIITGDENTMSGETAAAPAFDGRISTSYSLDGEISWKVPEGISEYIILSRFPDDCGVRLKLIQYASDGSVISETDVDKAYFKIQPGRRTATFGLSGNASIVEIIGR